MSISTYSGFTYGHTITDTNKFINFNEGAGDILASIEVGGYTLGGFVNAVSVALNNAGSLEYDLTIDRITRKITITSTAPFDLLTATGANDSQSAYDLMGFTGPDMIGLMSYEGLDASGSEFRPQNILQSYVDFKDNVKTTNASVNQSASGQVEVVSYGNVRFMECNVVPQTDILNQLMIVDDANGVENLRKFLSYCITKAPIEFVPDIDNPTLNITDCLLESTKQSRQGVDFKITQFKKLFAYFQSGNLVFREL